MGDGQLLQRMDSGRGDPRPSIKQRARKASETQGQPVQSPMNPSAALPRVLVLSSIGHGGGGCLFPLDERVPGRGLVCDSGGRRVLGRAEFGMCPESGGVWFAALCQVPEGF